MATPSSIPVASLRRKIREALALAPGYGKSESMLHELVTDLTGSPVSLQQLRDAREWNHEQGYIRSEDDDASDTILWYITKAGLAQQKI